MDIDDDDELTPDALAVYHREFRKIAEENREDIGSIRALTVTELGDIVIRDKDKLFDKPFDNTYLEVNYNYTSMENITCFDMEKTRKAQIFKDVDFYGWDKVSHIGENVFWGRLARAYTTRYIPNVLRVMYLTPVSLIRAPKSHKSYITSLVNAVIIFNEQNDYLRKNRVRYLKSIVKISLLGATLKEVKYRELLSHIRHEKILFVLLFPIASVGSCLMRRAIERHK